MGIVTLAILCLSVVSLFSFSVNAQQADSWPMFHGNLAHTGYLNAAGHSTNQTLWVFKTSGHVWSSPAVVNGVVYFGSFDHNVYAVNAKDGTKIWSFSTGGDIYSSPAVVSGVAYFGSYDDNVYAVGQNAGTTGTSSSSGIPNVIYYGIVIVVLIVVIAVAVVVLRKRH